MSVFIVGNAKSAVVFTALEVTRKGKDVLKQILLCAVLHCLNSPKVEREGKSEKRLCKELAQLAQHYTGIVKLYCGPENECPELKKSTLPRMAFS